MEKNLILTFNTADNKTYRLTIRNPKDDIEKSTVATVAEKIVNTKIFDNSKRELRSLKKVAYVTREENIVE